MNALLFIGLVIGLAVIPLLVRKMPTWGGVMTRLCPLLVCLYGFLPAILIRSALIDNSGLRSLVAVVYVVGIGVFGTVELNGAATRAER